MKVRSRLPVALQRRAVWSRLDETLLHEVEQGITKKQVALRLLRLHDGWNLKSLAFPDEIAGLAPPFADAISFGSMPERFTQKMA